MRRRDERDEGKDLKALDSSENERMPREKELISWLSTSLKLMTPKIRAVLVVFWFDRGPRALRPAPCLTFFLFRRKESQQRKRRPCREHYLLQGFCCGLA
jgi:hypothetical protein